MIVVNISLPGYVIYDKQASSIISLYRKWQQLPYQILK